MNPTHICEINLGPRVGSTWLREGRVYWIDVLNNRYNKYTGRCTSRAKACQSLNLATLTKLPIGYTIGMPLPAEYQAKRAPASGTPVG